MKPLIAVIAILFMLGKAYPSKPFKAVIAEANGMAVTTKSTTIPTAQIANGAWYVEAVDPLSCLK